MRIPEKFTTVTKFSKIVALIMFILLPFTGFLIGMKFQKSITIPEIIEVEKCSENNYSNKVYDQYINSKILKAEFIDCTVSIYLDSGEKLEIGNLNGSGMKNPPCLVNTSYKVSSSGKYMAFEDVSGGLDSTIRIFSLTQNIITTLYVGGTSTIMDYTFLPGGSLAVLSGYPNIFEEQWLTIYNVQSLYEDYKNNILNNPYPQIENQFSLQNKHSKSLGLSNFGENYDYLRISTEALIAHTKNPEKFTVFSPEDYTFSE